MNSSYEPIYIISRSAPAMLFTFLLIYLVRSASSDAGYEEIEISPRCRDSNSTGLTFTPADGYVGRYIAELCSKGDDMGKEWKLKVSFHDTLDKCDTSNRQWYYHFGTDHSTNVEYVSKHNCTDNQTVCISAPFDLIFNACYSISTLFTDRSSKLTNYYFNITNNYTEQFFRENKPQIVLKYFENYVSLTWYPGVPPSVYNIELCNEPDENSCTYVTDNCTTVDRTAIRCDLAPEFGHYKIRLKHIAPWIGGVFSKQAFMSFTFWRNATSSVSRDGTGAWTAWVWGAGGAALVVALALGGARLACRSAAAQRRRKELLHSLLSRRNGSVPVEGGANAGGGVLFKHVLLLYAREGAAAARAVTALKAALQHVIDGQVFDIFSPDVMADYAGASNEWVRSNMLRADVAVVILQSPALHCLYSTTVADTDTGVKLVPPSLLTGLGSGAVARVARRPQWGDALLQYALRLAAENLCTAHNYRKLYIATISELPTETLPCMVPYRRYPLPEAAPLLLRDLSSPARVLPVQLLDTFSQLLAEFVDYAKENPDYLMDELMLVDS